MDIIKQYRHELKYEISYADYLLMKGRLEKIMTVDPHSRDDGKYLVKSIYFDNYSNKVLKENIHGVEKREKFRIRFYNNDLSYITLEKKMKNGRLGLKYRTEITREELESLLRGDNSWMKETSNNVAKELYAKMQYQGLRPTNLVSYTRESFVYRPGNVRISFDSDIRTLMNPANSLKEESMEISATDTPQDMILEVKYDAFLPDIIKDLIQLDSIRVQAFSKYTNSRRFG